LHTDFFLLSSNFFIEIAPKVKISSFDFL